MIVSLRARSIAGYALVFASLFWAGGLAKAQLSNVGYRALGQPDLYQNALNLVQGQELQLPGGVATDSSDGPVHLYVSDGQNNRILAWKDAHTVQSGAPADLILGQPSRSSTATFDMFGPLGLAVQPGTGDLFVADAGFNRVLRFPKPFANPQRTNPSMVYGQPGLTGTSKNAGGISDHSLATPLSIAFDGQGNLWVADQTNSRVLRFPASALGATNPSADIVIGQKDFTTGSPNTGGISAATLDQPTGLAFDSKGTLYVSDAGNNRVLLFPAPQATGEAATVVLGQAVFTVRGSPKTGPAGTEIASPFGLAFDPPGNLYVADPAENRVLIFNAPFTSGMTATKAFGQANLTTITANTGASPKASPQALSAPSDVKFAADATIFIADTFNNRVVQIPAGGMLATVAYGQPDLSSNGANEIKPTSINAAFKMAIDYSKAPYPLYVSDTGNNRVLIWKDSAHFKTGAPADLVIGQPDLTTAFANADSATSLPTNTSLSHPRGIAVDSHGDLYVSDAGNNRVLRFPRPVDQSGRITADTVYGQPDFISNIPSSVNASSLNTPSGVAVAPNGDLFVADSVNNRVLEFPSGAPNGAAAVRVIGQPSFTQNTVTQVSAQTLASPQGIAISAASTLYVADTAANRIVIFPNIPSLPSAGASASVVIGQGSLTSAGAATGAANLRAPFDVAVDSVGQIYVSDNGNHRVLVFPALLSLPLSGGAAISVFGQRPGSFTTNREDWDSNNGAATPDGLAAPVGLFVDRRNTLYIGDTGNNRVLHVLRAVAAVSAADYLPGVAVAPGSLVALFGLNMADQTAAAQKLPLSAGLGNRQLTLNDSAPAYPIYVSAGQINFQVPATAATGANLLGVRTADTGELIAGGLIAVATASPGLFTLTKDGKGQGAILNQDGSPNGPANPAAPGSVISVFGTGQGPTNPVVPDGQPAPSGGLANTVAKPTTDLGACLTSASLVCAAFGTEDAQVQYSGLAPGFVGLWQLNIQIPGDAPSGSVSLRIVIDQMLSNTITVSVK